MGGSEQIVVVVEDDARIADLLDLYLRDAGFRPLLAPTGERALELGGVTVEHEAIDLEIRYLNRVKEGPVRARGELVPGGFDGFWVRVATNEPPADDRIVSLTTLQYRAV